MSKKLVYLLDNHSAFQQALLANLLYHDFHVYSSSSSRSIHLTLFDNPYIPDVILLSYKTAEKNQFTILDAVKVLSQKKDITIYYLVDWLDDLEHQPEESYEVNGYLLKLEDNISNIIKLLKEVETYRMTA